MTLEEMRHEARQERRRVKLPPRERCGACNRFHAVRNRQMEPCSPGWMALMYKAAELRNRAAQREQIAIERHADALDDALQQVERERLAGVIDAEARLLVVVEAAIQRYRAGTWGACLDCGEDIHPARLKAVPHAERCIGCQEQADQALADAGRVRIEERA